MSLVEDARCIHTPVAFTLGEPRCQRARLAGKSSSSHRQGLVGDQLHEEASGPDSRNRDDV